MQPSLSLVTITQLDPIAVSFPVPEGKLQDLLAAARSHTPVEALVTGRKTPLKGTLNFVDNTVDPLIGTVRAKAVFDNADQGLWPGQFVETRVTVRTLEGATVVPAAALMMLAEGSSVYVVDAERDGHAPQGRGAAHLRHAGRGARRRARRAGGDRGQAERAPGRQGAARQRRARRSSAPTARRPRHAGQRGLGHARQRQRGRGAGALT